MTTLHAVALGPDTDITHAVLCLSGDEVCDVAVPCDECEDIVCPEHTDEFTTCVANENLLHHLDCAPWCPECQAARAQDHAEGDDR